MRAHVVALAGVCLVFCACSSFDADPAPAVDAGGGPRDASSEAGGGDGCALPCGPTETCREGRCEPGCPDRVVYVSKAGSDANTGCSKEAPKATIGGAVAVVKTLGLQAHEIHVCKGTYDETALTLDFPVTLRGGYECSLWTRHEPFGFTAFEDRGRAVNFDTTNLTLVTSANATVLEITDASVTRDVLVEGFTFRGRTTDGGSTLIVRGDARPTLVSNVVRGPSGPSTTGSVGVEVLGSGAPAIEHCIIHGGGGGGPTSDIGSIGLRLRTSGEVLVHDNEIDSGDGVGRLVASVATLVEAPTALRGERALARNSIFFAGTAPAPGLTAATGIALGTGTQADVTDNRVIGGTSSCPDNASDASCFVRGITTGASDTRILRNRIWAGPSGSTKVPGFQGIFVGPTASAVDVFNNVVAVPTGTGTGIFAAHGGTRRRIAHNTIRGTGGTVTNGVQSYGPGTSLDNNLFLGLTIGLVTGSCTSPATSTAAAFTYAPPVHAESNVFVDTTTVVRFASGTCGTLEQLDLAGAEQRLTPAMHGNAIVRKSDCGTFTSAQCRVCPGALCEASVLEEAPTIADVLAGGLTMKAGAWCKIARGGIDLRDQVTDDVLGTPRPLTPTLGARQSALDCTP